MEVKVFNLKRFFSESEPTPEFSDDQAVIINLTFASDSKSSDDYQDLQALEDSLTSVLPEKSGIDGHDLFEDQATIYVYGPSADEIWNKIEPVLKQSDFSNVEITLQFGRPEDPQTKDRTFTL